jgi:LacI family transcriptional regulator
MRSHRTNVIGLLLSDVVAPYCIEIMRGVNQVIAQSDYDLLIYTNGDIRKSQKGKRESQFVMLLNGSITDGVIVVTPATMDFSRHAPLVIIDPNNESSDFPGVIATNREGALTAMNYLTGLGHRRIGYITGRLELISSIQRLQGYKDGLAAAGISEDEDLIKVGDYQTEQACECARELLSLSNRPTAIFAANDMSAAGVYQAAKDASLRIPEDLSVVGFDNLQESAHFDPPLTTVDQFIPEMGTIAAEIMVSLLKGEAITRKVHIVPTQLIVRDSCRSLK